MPATNIRIVRGLRDRAWGIEGGRGQALMQAAKAIATWPHPLVDMQACMQVPGVGADIALLVVTGILRRALTDDEEAYLSGARSKRHQRQ